MYTTALIVLTLAGQLGPSQAVLPKVAAGFTNRAARSAAGWTGRSQNTWRYVVHGGRWWYWSSSERWSYHDGRRWVQLDSLNQPMFSRRELADVAPTTDNGTRHPALFDFRFGEIPAPSSRASSFASGNAAPVAGRNFAGSFGESPSPGNLLSPHTGSQATIANPYNPDSVYGAYGTTDPFRGGLHTGAGGNYGYGQGTARTVIDGGSGP